MATHATILAWRIPGKEEPGGLQSIMLQKSWARLKPLSMHGLSFKWLVEKMNLWAVSSSGCLVPRGPFLSLPDFCSSSIPEPWPSV